MTLEEWKGLKTGDWLESEIMGTCVVVQKYTAGGTMILAYMDNGKVRFNTYSLVVGVDDNTLADKTLWKDNRPPKLQALKEVVTGPELSAAAQEIKAGRRKVEPVTTKLKKEVLIVIPANDSEGKLPPRAVFINDEAFRVEFFETTQEHTTLRGVKVD